MKYKIPYRNLGTAPELRFIIMKIPICVVSRDCNYLLGLRVEPGPGDQVSVGVAAVDTSLKIVQVRHKMCTTSSVVWVRIQIDPH
jgi:hypothetical protein